MIMIRDDRYKFISCPVDPSQLFDLHDDPHELHNLAARPEFAHLIDSFRKQMDDHVDVETLDREVHASQRRRRIVFTSHMTGKHTPWDFHPCCNAANEFMRNHLDLNDVESNSRIG
jgi:choline-sulfatase